MKKNTIINITLIIAVLALIIIGIFIIRPVIINNNFEKHSSKGEFLEEDKKALKSIENLTFPEGYITNYNLGNYYYHEKDYGKAIKYYSKALELAPKDKEKDCNIRINLVLSNLNTMDFEKIEKSEDKSEAIKELKALREILTENGCACPERDKATGHSEDAEKLKKDIDDELDKLQDDSNQDQDQNQQSSENQEQEENKENDSSDKQLENKLTQQKSENNKKRQQEQQESKNYNGGKTPSLGQNQNEGSASDSGEEGGDSSESDKNTKVW